MPNRHLSSLLISFRGRTILFDCGEGTQVAMRKFKTGFKTIDIICISHVHGDHLYGLPGLLSTMGNSERTEMVTLIGPRGFRNFMDKILFLVPNLPFPVRIIEGGGGPLIFRLEEDRLLFQEKLDKYKENLTIDTLELDHSTECLGYSLTLNRRPKFLVEKAEEYDIPKNFWKRLQNGETISYKDREYCPELVLGEERSGIKISYITDSRPVGGIVDFINKSKLFICEGSYGDDADLHKAIKNKHMTFREAAKLALEGQVEELILTHFSPSMDEPSEFIHNARESFANTSLAYDGLSKTIGF